MWSIQAIENGIFRKKDIPEPCIGINGDIIVKMKYACIGRIDAAALYGSLSLVKKKPYVIGNEGAGTIVALNENAKAAGFYIDQNVSGICTQPCGCCNPCRRGLTNLCDNPHQSGILSEYVCFRITQTEPIPSDVSLSLGALTSSVNRAIHILEKAKVMPGSSLLILGCNGIAQICVMLAKLYGLSSVAVIGSNEHLCELALHNGADVAAISRTQDGKAAISRLTRFQGYDAVIDTWVDPDTSYFGFENLSKGGRYIVASIAVDDIGINATELCWKGLSVEGCYEPLIIHPSLKYIMPKLNLQCLIGGEFDVHQIDKAFQKVMTEPCMRALIRLD